MAEQGGSLPVMHATLCNVVVDAVAGCDHASIMVLDRDGLRTAAYSDAAAEASDRAEIELREGPCLELVKSKTEDFFLVTDLGGSLRWPSLTDRLLSSTPVRGIAGLRMHLPGKQVAALNLLSDTPGGLTEEAIDDAAMICAFAAVAALAQDRGRQATTLRSGLQSNRKIGTAMGIIMSSYGLSSDEAFNVLSRLSQENNVKLADLATSVVKNSQPAGGPTEG